MNAQEKGKNSGKSDLAKSKLFGALGHVHNPFSLHSRGSHGVEKDKHSQRARGELMAMSFEAEMTRIEAGIMAERLIARFQKG
jgi:hypothetical protein